MHFDRIELHVISDAATAAAALQTGEIDWVEQMPPDIVQVLRQRRNLQVEPIGQHDNYGALRLNHLQRPFNVKAIRQAIWPAIEQPMLHAGADGRRSQRVGGVTWVFFL